MGGHMTNRSQSLWLCAAILAAASACGTSSNSDIGRAMGADAATSDAGSSGGGGSGGSGGTGFADGGSDSSWGGSADTAADAGWSHPGDDTGTSDDTGGSWSESDGGSWGDAGDAGSAPDAAADAGADADLGGGNTNVNIGGAQDFGYFRRLLDDGRIPHPDDFEAAGFFAEHHTPLPHPVCGERICLQALLGVMGNLMDGSGCTMVQVGLNSPLVADERNRPPLNLVVVVDRSGSMSADGKIGYVRQGLEILIDEMRDEDRLAIIAYSDGAEILQPLTQVGLNRRDLRTAVAALEAGGATNLYGGLEVGYHEALSAYDSGRQNRVILLSDGQPTAGPTDPDTILSMSASYNSEGIGITTIGLGTDFNLPLMRGLSEQGDGNFYFVESPSAVEEVFGQEISYFTVPVAFDLRLELREGSRYQFGAARGSRMWAPNADGGSLAIPSVFLAHRESHSDVEPGGGRRGGGSALLVELMPRDIGDDGSGIESADVATIDMEFREPGTNRIVTETVTVNYPAPPWVLLRRGHFDEDDPAIVQKSFVMLNIFVGIEAACGLFHDNPRSDAGLVALRQLTAAVEDYNDEVGDVDIDFDLELLRQLESVLLANGVPDPDWVDIDEDPWPAD